MHNHRTSGVSKIGRMSCQKCLQNYKAQSKRENDFCEKIILTNYLMRNITLKNILNNLFETKIT